MNPARNLVTLLFTINLCGLGIIAVSYYRSLEQTQNTVSLRNMATTDYLDDVLSYKFHNPSVAYKLLQKLDIFEVVESSDKSYTKFYEGLKINNNYCDDHRAYFVEHPEFMFNEKNFLTDYWKTYTFRKRVIPEIGQDVHPEVSLFMKDINTFTYDQKPNIHIFYNNVKMFVRRLIGKQFSCLTQISNHIPGNRYLERKDSVGEALAMYAQSYQTRPQCFNNNKFFPKTWVLTDLDQCQEFFEEFNSPKYQELKKERNIVYFRKIGADAHEGKGVFVVDDAEEVKLRNLYKNGSLCGKVKANNVMQTFIHNPLLIDGHKFDFRVMMFVASTNPMIVYHYDDGLLKVSLHKYDTTSKEKGVFLTNVAMSKPLFSAASKNGTYNGLTADEMKDKTYLFYPDLYNYLHGLGKVNDPNWIENHLRTQLKTAMIHLIRISQAHFMKRSSLMELYGLDFMMDENLDLWFIEANPIPGIEGWTTETREYFYEMLIDHFEISFGLLRSRAKRIINYINRLTANTNSWRIVNDEIEIDNLEERQQEFRKLTMNKFELEFVPSSDNKFSLIIDENYLGPYKYFGLIEEECL